MFKIQENISRIKRLSFYSFLSVITLLMGLVREVLVASYYGLSSELDVYVALNSLYLLFGMQLGNALEMATIAKYGKNPTVDYLKENYLSVVIFLLLLNVIIGIIVVNFDNYIVGSVFGGFSDYQLEVASEMMVFIVLSFVFANLSGFNRGNLNILRKFAPNFLNGGIISLSVIVFVVALAEYLEIQALFLGFMIGNFLVFVIFSYSLYKNNVIDFSLIRKVSYKSILPLLKASLLIMIGEVLYQAYILVIRSHASELGEGVISSFFYANTLVLVPVTLVMFPLSTILFPKLTEMFSNREVAAQKLFYLAMTLLLACSLGSALFMYFISEILINVIFVRGEFTLEDAKLTSSIFSVLVFMLPAISVSRLIKMGHYALGSFKVPIVSNAILAVSAILVSSYLVPQYGIYGLSISGVVAMYISVVLMFVSFMYKLKLWYS